MTEQHYALFDTPIGICGIEWGSRGINGVQLPMGSDEKTRSRIRQRRGDISETAPTKEVREAIDRILKLLAGEPDDLRDIALDLEGVPEFNRGVYDIARTIPPGQTMTYGDIAKRLGGVELSRDVGQALGRNPCPIVVPCHRVLAAGQKPGGFSAKGGISTKLKMLAIEGAAVNHTPGLFD
jgi:methylated-DNA-[protein]-cysteine S-methyltransferase